MTTITTTAASDDHPSTVTRLSRYLGDVARLLHAARETERLMQLSDAELARRGLCRDEIVTRTFADYLHGA